MRASQKTSYRQSYLFSRRNLRCEHMGEEAEPGIVAEIKDYKKVMEAEAEKRL